MGFRQRWGGGGARIAWAVPTGRGDKKPRSGGPGGGPPRQRPVRGQRGATRGRRRHGGALSIFPFLSSTTGRAAILPRPLPCIFERGPRNRIELLDGALDDGLEGWTGRACAGTGGAAGGGGGVGAGLVRRLASRLACGRKGAVSAGLAEGRAGPSRGEPPPRESVHSGGGGQAAGRRDPDDGAAARPVGPWAWRTRRSWPSTAVAAPGATRPPAWAREAVAVLGPLCPPHPP